MLLFIISLCIIIFFTSYAPACIAANAVPTETSFSFLQTLSIGMAIGVTVTVIIIFILSKNYYLRYKKMAHKLAEAIKAKNSLQQEFSVLRQAQQNSQDVLEESVQERTLELNIALQELEQANHELELKNTIDDLTGLYNRRFYDQKIMAEYRRSKRNLTPLSLVIIDIDHFKNVNDNYGHLAGDQCLTWLSKLIKQCLRRSSDMGFRYGGEEFCLILPDTDNEGAMQLAEILRRKIEKQTFSYQDITISLTISCGVSTYQQENDVLPEQLFMAADKALYQAKHNGRNQSQLYQFTQGQCSTSKQ